MPSKIMEIDHISYIFGSFARRRQSQNVSSTKRKSIETPKVNHDRSKSAPHNVTKSETSCNRTKSFCNISSSQLNCPLCHQEFYEPRILPCLHTFCITCLKQLEEQAFNQIKDDRRSTVTIDSNNKERRTTSSNERTHQSTTIQCPHCGSDHQLPSSGGVKSFPLNYLIQNRLVLAALNSQNTKLLCDLCTGDNIASCRCSQCALSLCKNCAENHLKHKTNLNHEVLRLEDARKKGITTVRRQVMCPNHKDIELSIFCSTCCQVTCRECFTMNHKGHINESITRAAKIYASNIKMALGKTRTIAERSSGTSFKLQATSQRIENHCNQVQGDIDKFIEAYINAIEQHRRKLHQEVQIAKIEKVHKVDVQLNDLQRQLHLAKEILAFADDLFRESNEVEFLTLVKPILRRLEVCNQIHIPELPISESLQFLPEEASQESWNSCPLYGVVTTQIVSPSHCSLLPEGLQNLRVGKKAEILLELYDKTNTALQRGGEVVYGEVKYKEPGSTKTINMQIEDKKNGTYKLSFIPDVPGKYFLSVTVKGQPIKDNPTIIIVRPFRPHYGTYHCCSFCSSGGLKDAMCGCGGKMPGGYKGCGHGHEGHPGRRHWSCCGSTLEHSECQKRSSTHYQFTL
ncbi:E3 ubiquitin-protein ligase TRIM45-like [Onthophagus taurus]|uniref:E3 ubiquitin-protein ligase TRIM45-like n=1 Tax=Onthophagus taurus TaxID=166361 RepID=UPI0039BEB487